MSRLPQRWRTQRNAICNANCKTSWIIKILNAHCASRICLVACLSECLWTQLSIGAHPLVCVLIAGMCCCKVVSLTLTLLQCSVALSLLTVQTPWMSHWVSTRCIGHDTQTCQENIVISLVCWLIWHWKGAWWEQYCVWVLLCRCMGVVNCLCDVMYMSMYIWMSTPSRSQLKQGYPLNLSI